MKRSMAAILITLVFGFTGVAHSGDVAISSHKYSDGETAWVVIKNKIWYCANVSPEGKTPVSNCRKMKMIED